MTFLWMYLSDDKGHHLNISCATRIQARFNCKDEKKKPTKNFIRTLKDIFAIFIVFCNDEERQVAQSPVIYVIVSSEHPM